MPMLFRAIAALLLAMPGAALAQNLPAQVSRQLPAGYGVLHSAAARFEGHDLLIVALGRKDEDRRANIAPDRPLLIYERRSGSYVLAARNDHVVLRADEGLQCDPFEDGGITAKGRYFTVENVVACGQHWTWYVTFRFDPRLNTYVFDNQRAESWSPNPSDAPDAEALISDGGHLVRARKGRPVRFVDWRPGRN